MPSPFTKSGLLGGPGSTVWVRRVWRPRVPDRKGARWATFLTRVGEVKAATWCWLKYGDGPYAWRARGRSKKKAEHSRLVGSSSNKQENLQTGSAFRFAKWAVSHACHSGGLHTTLLSKGCILAMVPTVDSGGQNYPHSLPCTGLGGGRQLLGSRSRVSSHPSDLSMTSSITWRPLGLLEAGRTLMGTAHEWCGL